MHRLWRIEYLPAPAPKKQLHRLQRLCVHHLRWTPVLQSVFIGRASEDDEAHETTLRDRRRNSTNGRSTSTNGRSTSTNGRSASTNGRSARTNGRSSHGRGAHGRGADARGKGTH